MRALTWKDFAEAEGRAYRVRLHEGDVDLTLVKAETLGSGETSFRLEFLGPQQPILPQASYSLEYGEDADFVFIVPIANDANGTTYEAIFN